MTEKTDLFAKGGLEKPSQEDGEDAEEEGEYGGEEETPPFPLLQTLLLPEDGDAIRRRGLHHQLNDLPSLWNKQIMPIMAITAMATTKVSQQVHEHSGAVLVLVPKTPPSTSCLCNLWLGFAFLSL